MIPLVGRDRAHVNLPRRTSGQTKAMEMQPNGLPDRIRPKEPALTHETPRRSVKALPSHARWSIKSEKDFPTPPPESQLRFPAFSTLFIGHLDSWDHRGSHSCLLSPPPEPGRWVPATEAPHAPILNPTGHEILYI
jgi:hypothetical protein